MVQFGALDQWTSSLQSSASDWWTSSLQSSALEFRPVNQWFTVWCIRPVNLQITVWCIRLRKQWFTVQSIIDHWTNMRVVVQGDSKNSLSKATAKWDQAWSPNGRVIVIHVLGFEPAPRFLWSQILCRLYKSPLDETINRGPPLNAHAKRSHTHVKDPVVHIRVRWITETPK